MSFDCLLVRFFEYPFLKNIIDNNDRYEFTLFTLICNDLNTLRYIGTAVLYNFKISIESNYMASPK